MILLASLFTLGTIAFWFMLFAVSVFIIICDVYEREGRAFSTLALFVGAILFFNPELVIAVREHPLYLLYGFVAYIVLGVATAIAKWYFFLLNVKDEISDRLADEDRDIYSKITQVYVRGRKVALPIKVSNFKARITGWMTYWPWVAVWTLLDDPIRRLFQRIYRFNARLLQNMADRFVPNVPEPPARPEPPVDPDTIPYPRSFR
jgi:hypothetical protein